MGTIVTFYSYKGGVGRTMALVNIAAIMAGWGKKVLIVDWDLEAPGIEHFLTKEGELASLQRGEGLIEILTRLSDGATVSDELWKPLLKQVHVGKCKTPISLLTAGAHTDAYFRNVRQLDVRSFYEDKNGGNLIEGLRNTWKSNYEFILIDSRTGITDIGGICTIQLPDILAIVFTATTQSLQGAVEVAKKSAIERQKLPFDRSVVPTLPIPSRFDTQTEQKISQEWLDRFVAALTPSYANWLPKEIDRRKFLERTKIPYTPYYSFGEVLPVIDQGTTDSTGMGYAYETVAALITNKLQYADTLMANRDEFVRLARSRSRLPKTALRELPWESVLYVDLVAASALKAMPLDIQSNILNQYQSTVDDSAQREGGVLVMSNEDSFLFAFPDAENALRCAVVLQEALAVKTPIRIESLGHLQVRMALHCSDEHGDPTTRMATCFQVASRIASKAQEGQILASKNICQQIATPLENIEFDKINEQLEIEIAQGIPWTTELFEVVQFVTVFLDPQEKDALFKQDQQSKSNGGFQSFLVALQDKTGELDNRLKLTISDRERIARYAHDYKAGGWQRRLVNIFGRVLGPNLGRENG